MMGLAPPLRTVSTSDSRERARRLVEPATLRDAAESVSSAASARRASAGRGTRGRRRRLDRPGARLRTRRRGASRSPSPATSSAGSIVNASRNDRARAVSAPVELGGRPRHTSAFTRSRPVARCSNRARARPARAPSPRYPRRAERARPSRGRRPGLCRQDRCARGRGECEPHQHHRHSHRATNLRSGAPVSEGNVSVKANHEIRMARA